MVLGAWFREEGKDYPWRRTADPYAILVSEVMLQQTQIATVLGPKDYYRRWLEIFPDVATLARAPEDAVLKAWEGLGYYRRARNLQKAARAVVEEFDGVFPSRAADILKLPGVGRYTAGAVASFAFNLPEPIVDANIARVLARLYDYRGHIDSEPGKKFLWDRASALVAGEGAREFNSAIMELGQRICLPRAPACRDCPVAASCASREKNPGELPLKKARVEIEKVDEHVLFCAREESILLHREEKGRRREGLWRLPERPREELAGLPLLLEMKYSITRYRVTLRVYDAAAPAKPGPGEKRIPLEDLPGIPMPAPYRKAVETILADSTAQLELGPGMV